MQLTHPQKLAVQTTDKDLCIIACPGAGKTRVVVARILHLLKTKQAKPHNIVAITYTRKAGEELCSRIFRSAKNFKNLDEMFVGTIHSYALRLLDGYQLLEPARLHLFIEKHGLNKQYDVSAFIEAMSVISETPQSKPTRKIMRLYQEYRQTMLDNGYVDFSLILRMAYEQLLTDEVLRSQIAENLKFLMVDEYQDVNPIQELMIKELHSLGANLCTVGDDEQTIYQWRGSQPQNILQFARRYQGSVEIRLEDNFRSTQGIIYMVKTFSDKTMNAASGLVFEKGDIVCRDFGTNDDEANFIAAKSADIIAGGVCPSEIAVLCRTRRIMADIAFAFEAKGVPCVQEDAKGFFRDDDIENLCECFFYLNKTFPYMSQQYYRDEFFNKRVLDYLDGVDLDGDELSLSDIYFGIFKIIKKPHETFLQVIDDFESIYDDTQPPREKLTLFCKFLERGARDKYENPQPKKSQPAAVRIMTAHSAKGLEFHAVFVPGLNRGYFPYYKSKTNEERKLFYVAITRAKKILVLTRSRQKRGRHYRAIASPFFKGVKKYLDKNSISNKIKA